MLQRPHSAVAARQQPTAPAVTATAALLPLLKPWLERAQRRISITLDEFVEPSDLVADLWIKWNLTATPDWTADIEAMELLDLLARVDYREAWYQIFMMADASVYFDILDALLPIKIFPRFQLYWRHWSDFDSEFIPKLQSFITEDKSANRSPKFQEAKTTLLALVTTPQHRIPISIDWNMEVIAREQTATTLLRQFAAIVVSIRDPARREQRLAAPSRFTFALERLVLSGDDTSIRMSDSMLRQLQALTKKGIEIATLTLGSWDFRWGTLTPSRTATFFRTLLVGDSTQTLMPSGVCVSPHLQALCSALVANQSVDDVCVWLPRHRSQFLYWSWIAYALFSSDASSHIQCVDLDVQQLTPGGVLEFERVLDARDPLAVIAQSIRGQSARLAMDPSLNVERDPVLVELRSDATLYGDPALETSIELPNFRATGNGTHRLRLVDDDPVRNPASVCVLYPGAGLAWVRRDAITQRIVLEQQTTVNSETKMFSRLGLTMAPRTSLLMPLLSLLRRIGFRVRYLTLTATDSVALDDSFLRDVLAACPHITRLDLARMRVTSLTWLRDQKLRSLSLTDVRCREHTQLVGHLLAKMLLEDTQSPLTQTLEELYLEEPAPVLARSWYRLMDAIQANRRFYRLVFATYNRDGKITGERIKRLQQLHGAPLPIRKAPVPLRCKLAFLSVVATGTAPSRSSTGTTRRTKRPRREDEDGEILPRVDEITATTHAGQRLVPELDVTLVAMVFEFAAPHKTRVCGFGPL